VSSFRKRCRHPREQWDECSCAWYADTYRDGQRVRINLGRDKYEALRRWGDMGTPSGEFKPVAERWLASQGGIRAKTAQNYRTMVGRLVGHFGMTPIDAIGTAAILDFEAGMWADGKRAGTIRNHRSCLLGIIRYAANQGLCRDVPRLRGIRDPAGGRVPHLTPQEAKHVLEHADEVHRFMYLTGVRAGEALGLRPEDIDHAHTTIRVRRQRTQSGEITPPKTMYAERAIELTGAAYKLVKDSQEPYLFDMGYHTLLRTWHDACDAAGQQQSGLHILRHSNAALRIAAGQDLMYVAEQLGHASAAFTLRVYGHLIRRPDQSASLDRAYEALVEG
jgi:integrase